MMIIIVLLISAIIGAACWTYTINTWLVYLGHAPQMRWYEGALIGFVPYLGQLSVPAAVITWIAMMFLR
jgi:hypothetical protein